MGECRLGSQRQIFGSCINPVLESVTIDFLGSKSTGTLVKEGSHILIRAVACPINGLNYDESQMKDNDVQRRQRLSEVEYDC